MTTETQQKILKVLSLAFADLDKWLKGLGASEEQIVLIYAKIIEENGIAAQLIAGITTTVVPLSAQIETQPAIIEWFRRARSEDEFAAWLLTQPEPDPANLKVLHDVLTALKDALPNLRQLLLGSAKPGPQHRSGGRPKELDDPKVRKEICEKIKARRGPGTNLEDIFRSVAREYTSSHSEHREPISPSTIKRVWQRWEKERVTRESAEGPGNNL